MTATRPVAGETIHPEIGRRSPAHGGAALQDVIDPRAYLGPKRSPLVNESWAGSLREHVLPGLPVNRLAVYYADRFGRPNKVLYAVWWVIFSRI